MYTCTHKQTLAVASQTASYLERRKMLIEAFGSRRQRSSQASREANVINAQNVAAGDEVTQILQQTALRAAAADGGASKGNTNAHRALANMW